MELTPDEIHRLRQAVQRHIDGPDRLTMEEVVLIRAALSQLALMEDRRSDEMYNIRQQIAELRRIADLISGDPGFGAMREAAESLRRIATILQTESR